MKSFDRLLQQIRRKQLLLCAYPPRQEAGEPRPSLEHATTALRISSDECRALTVRLVAKGLLHPMVDAEGDRLQLTDRGERLVRRMSGQPGVAAL